MKQKFKLWELPYAEMAKMGLSKNCLFGTSKEELNKLLCGKKSKICFSLTDTTCGEHINYLAHIGFRRSKDGKVILLSFSIKDSYTEHGGLTHYDKLNLSGGFVISKTLACNGVPHRVLLQISKKSGQLKCVSVANFTFPESIDGFSLSKEDRKRILQYGSPFEINRKESFLTIGIDLDRPDYLFTLREHNEKWEKRKMKFIKYSMPPLNENK